MSLATGEKIHRRHWTELPISENTISRVHALAIQDQQPLIQHGNLLVEWNPGQPVDEDEYDANYIPPAGADDDDDYDPDDYDSEDENEDDDDNQQGGDDDDLDEGDAPPAEMEEPDKYAAYDAPDFAEDGGVNAPADEEAPDPVEEEGAHAPAEEKGANAPANADEDAEDAAINDITSRRPGLRPRTARSYNHRLDHEMDQSDHPQSYTMGHQFVQHIDKSASTSSAVPDEDLHRDLVGFIFTQMSAKAGIKKHGNDARAALLKEARQLNDKNVFTAFDATSLTYKQKGEVLRTALRAVNLIKEKRDGGLKGRTCANGRSQRGMYEKSETSSPTISSEALFISLMIDAHEKRDVATADVAGAYLHADMPDYVILRFEGEMVDIMLEINPELASGIITDKHGNRILIVVLAKALYGCVKSGLLWYDLFSSTLIHEGFKLNPVDACVANATINDKQCTIGWFVDDNKISHVDQMVVTDIIGKIEDKFGKMTVTRGKKHKFIGMDIEFLDNGTVKILMADYLRDAIKDFGPVIKNTVSTPAQNGFFTIDEDSPRLSKVDSEKFLSVVYKVMYVSMRARSDLVRPSLGFLMTRVKVLTAQDWKKLKRVLEFINGTIDDPFYLGADDLHSFATWVDVSFATHHDMKSHTGGVITFGTGGIMCMSNKQKLNTKSSTEAEFVGASDYLPNTIYVQMFLAGQGIKTHLATLEQDNESTIKLLKNGRRSAGQRSRHIDIRYFFVTDRLRTNNITVRYCNTATMLADYLSKPLQGRSFRLFRAVLLGHKPVSALLELLPRASEERVEKTFESEPSSGVYRGGANRRTHNNNRVRFSHSLE